MKDEVESICLVRECREMEESFGTQFTMDTMKKKDVYSFKEMKKAILDAGKTIRMNRCGEKSSCDCQCG